VQKQIAFFREAVKNIKTSGSIAPSSTFLIKKMLRNIDFSKDLVLVEYGAANGIITHEILNRMTNNSKLICFEINSVFYEELSKNILDNRVVVINESADNVIDSLQRLNIFEIDFCISSLPLAMMPATLCSSILNNTKSLLKPNGKFIQYQYSLQYYKQLKKTFNKENIRLDFVFMNLPPAFVYNCEKK
jgi:phospholipid N-methyltransferase